jgi:hypothetical protein
VLLTYDLRFTVFASFTVYEIICGALSHIASPINIVPTYSTTVIYPI